MQVQNKWVPLALGLLFGIMALLALLATALLLARHVRSGSFFLALLWLWTALYFFAGTGARLCPESGPRLWAGHRQCRAPRLPAAADWATSSGTTLDLICLRLLMVLGLKCSFKSFT